MHILPLATTIGCCKHALQFTLKSQTSLHLQVCKYASMQLCKFAPFALCFVSPKTFKLLFYSRFYPPQKSAAVRHTHGRICRRMSNLGLQGCILAIWARVEWRWIQVVWDGLIWIWVVWDGLRWIHVVRDGLKWIQIDWNIGMYEHSRLAWLHSANQSYDCDGLKWVVMDSDWYIWCMERCGWQSKSQPEAAPIGKVDKKLKMLYYSL